MKKTLIIYIILLFTMFSNSCDTTIVNRSLTIANGQKINDDLSSVNGRIEVGENCLINGDCQTVNGSIKIGNFSKVKEVKTVNGNIELREGVEVDGDIELINGNVQAKTGSHITGDITSINGEVALFHTIVHQNLSVVNGDILLDDGTDIKGDIIIRGKPGRHAQVVKIEIKNGSKVQGDIRVKDSRKKVEVYLSEDNKIFGEVINATLIKGSN